MSAAAEAVDAAVELCAAAVGLYHLLGHPDDLGVAEGKRKAVLDAVVFRADRGRLLLTRWERGVLATAVESAAGSNPDSDGMRRRRARKDLLTIAVVLISALTGHNISGTFARLLPRGTLDDAEGRRFLSRLEDTNRPLVEFLSGLAFPCEEAAERLFSRLGSSQERLDSLLSK